MSNISKKNWKTLTATVRSISRRINQLGKFPAKKGTTETVADTRLPSTKKGQHTYHNGNHRHGWLFNDLQLANLYQYFKIA